MTAEEAFIRAIVDSPGDEGPRLVYADWLEERSDPRSPYLRAEHTWNKSPPRRKPAALQQVRSLAELLEVVWVARVSRLPVGVCMEAELFRRTQKPTTESAIQSLASGFGVEFPADYQAFLLNYNGGGFLYPPCTRDGAIDETAFSSFFAGIGLDEEEFPNLEKFANLIFETVPESNRYSGLFPICAPDQDRTLYLLGVGTTRLGKGEYFGRVYVTQEPFDPWSVDEQGKPVPEGIARSLKAGSFPELLAQLAAWRKNVP